MRAMAVTTKPVPFHFTVDDLELMPQIEGARYELVDGELYVSTAPHFMHQLAATRMASALNEWSRSGLPGEAVTGPGLIFDRQNAVIPDVVWIRRGRFAHVLGADGKLHDAPDLVVEILSPGTTNTVRDREVKLGLYAQRGVPEYWIVDWQRREVDVYRHDGHALIPVATLDETDTLTSPMLPGFRLPLPQLFAGLP
jgi:Uma2 family endonuclease